MKTAVAFGLLFGAAIDNDGMRADARCVSSVEALNISSCPISRSARSAGEPRLQGLLEGLIRKSGKIHSVQLFEDLEVWTITGIQPIFFGAVALPVGLIHLQPSPSQILVKLFRLTMHKLRAKLDGIVRNNARQRQNAATDSITSLKHQHL